MKNNDKKFDVQHPYFITGFSDGEATFTISITKDNRERKTARRKDLDKLRDIFSVHPSFAISLSINFAWLMLISLAFLLWAAFDIIFACSTNYLIDFTLLALPVIGEKPSSISESQSVIYINLEIQKKQIISENKGKSGVYVWTNLLNGKRYVGSAADLSKRLYHYFSVPWLKRKLKTGKSIIYNSILKNGLSNFSVEILVYCENEKTVILKNEQYFMNLLKPAAPPPPWGCGDEYNISPTAGSPLGYKQSEETKLKRAAFKYSDEIKLKMRDAAIGRKHSIETRSKICSSQPNSKKIEVTNLETKITTSYDSISAAAKALNIKQSIISGYFSRNKIKPYKGKYVFSLASQLD